MTTGSHIYGNSSANSLTGGAGNDTINAYGGNDTVHAGDGNDYVTGDDGKDVLYGENGNDSLFGGTGNDTLFGGAGNDQLYGGADNDSLSGGDGNDSIDAGKGADLVYGGDGNDTIYGGTGASCDSDTIYGGHGADLIYGGGGGDHLIAGAGNDTVYGGHDNDVIAGGAGDDSLFGGSGNDTIEAGKGNDTVDAGKGDDLVCADEGNNLVYGGSGNDTVYTGAGNDTLYGGAGNDSFYIGAGGHDTVDGGTNGGGTCGSPGVDQIYIAGPVTITLSPSVVIHATVGQTIDLSTYKDYNGTITDSHGTVVNFDNIEKINVVKSISEPSNCICFTPGTLIATRNGLKPVESLREGDKIITRDNGMQEVRWTGQRTLDAAALAMEPSLRPVLIRAGSLGHGLPDRDMLVSPNHRMLVMDERNDMYFGTSEVLVAAKHLTRKPGIHRVETEAVTYVHVLFDRHEVILGDGAWTESFQPGDYSMGGLLQDQRKEILTLFPELRSTEGLNAYGAARPTLKKAEAATLN